GIKANDNISFAIEKGEIRALVGENGAGKTTLMKILYGIYQPDTGEIEINGVHHVFHSPLDAIKSGLGMVHQHFMLFSQLSVVDNIIFGMEPQLAGFIKKNQAKQDVIRLSQLYHLEVDPDAKVGDLPVGVRQRVEILKTLYRHAEILIFDEPTAVLTPQEQVKFFEVLHTLASQGKTIIFITHKLNEVLSVSDNITVMRLGKVTAQLKTSETNVEVISRYMVGREIQFALERDKIDPGNVVLSVRNLCVFDKENIQVLNNVSFDVREGEIIGIAGVAGNGQDALIRSISGLSEANYSFGRILLNGEEITNSSNWERREDGMAYIPEDRSTVGLALQANVAENLLLGYMDDPEISNGILINRVGLQKFSQQLVEKYNVKTSDVFEPASNLSGGNLQKLIVAREMEHNSKFLIAEQPTRGVDIGSIELIHEFILKQRSMKNAILLVSTELSEVLALSDRILVMFEGRIIGEMEHDDADEHRIGLMMAGIVPDDRQGLL
ncbi:MAG: ABC transporter ATP-binding protein, partial [Chloroflexi bacterium]|nr:ABC transporter ATP-binding protein [Chloroflexota bacterium]